MTIARLSVAPVATRHRLVREGIQGIDRMSFDHLAEALSHVVEQMEKPVVVGIFAPWGAGKSFLLREVKRCLTKCSTKRGAWSAVKNTRAGLFLTFAFTVIGTSVGLLKSKLEKIVEGTACSKSRASQWLTDTIKITTERFTSRKGSAPPKLAPKAVGVARIVRFMRGESKYVIPADEEQGTVSRRFLE
ncbi:unnamed protein product, partial [Sphacelaria rigidula]